jgi:glucokinase
VQGLGPLLDFDELRPGFESKGRFAAYLRDVPLYRVMTDDLAARGIAGLLAGAVEAPVLEA